MKARQAIQDAFTEIGRVALGNNIDSDNLAHGLRLLNRMIDAWKAQNIFIPYTTEIVQTVTGSPITIGTGGTINTERPTQVLDASFFRISGIDYPFQWITQEEFNAVSLKEIDSIPRYGWYEQGLPLSKLHFYPRPTNYELHLRVNGALPAFADYDIDYQVEAGYQDAIIKCLKVDACAGFREPTQSIMVSAENALRVIKTANARSMAWPTTPISQSLSRQSAFLSGQNG
jgi:hypothetical protein